MRFAFLIMGNFDSAIDKTEICGGAAEMIGVKSIEDAMEVARNLKNEGIGCIELCGAFGEEGARKIIEATGNELPVCYCTHLKEQDEIFETAFADLEIPTV